MKNIDKENKDLIKFFQDMQKNLYKEYSSEDFEKMEKEYKLLEQER